MTKPRILVVGDILLDRYLHGTIERVNPETPGVVFSVQRTEHRLGGAAAVAYLCDGLDCETTIIGTVGTDEAGDIAAGLMRESEIANRCQRHGSTTVKQRCVAGGRLLYDRLDWNYDCEITAEQWSALIRGYAADEFDCIVIADYGRGAVVHAVPALRKQFAGTPIIVDPSRNADWRERYDGATFIKCNRSEAVDGTMPVNCREIITLGEDGIYCDGLLLPTDPRRVVDVTGCGDTVSAVLAWQLAQGVSVEDACRLANKAAGLQVERLGVQQIRPYEIESSGKCCDAVEFSEHARSVGKRIVFTNGCFDVLHAGHVETLKRAKAMGDVLIVGLNSDSSVRRLKGESRPIHSKENRAAVLSALECVDCVVVFDEDTPEWLIQEIRPDVLVKGEDTSEVIGREFVESYGGTVELLQLLLGLSSTAAIKAIEAENEIPC